MRDIVVLVVQGLVHVLMVSFLQDCDRKCLVGA